MKSSMWAYVMATFTGVVVCLLVLVSVQASWQMLYAAEPKEVPPRVFNVPDGVQFDCVLLQYDDSRGGEKNMIPASHHVLKVLDGGRVVSYPSGYVPIIVPKDKVKEVKKLLGEASVLQISPRLE